MDELPRSLSHPGRPGPGDDDRHAFETAARAAADRQGDTLKALLGAPRDERTVSPPRSTARGIVLELIAGRQELLEQCSRWISGRHLHRANQGSSPPSRPQAIVQVYRDRCSPGAPRADADARHPGTPSITTARQPD